MKLRTAIVEDQKPDAERLEQLLKKAFGEEGPFAGGLCAETIF